MEIGYMAVTDELKSLIAAYSSRNRKASRRLSLAWRRLRPSASQRTPVDEATACVHSMSWMAALAVLRKPVKVGYAIHGRPLSSVAHHEHEPHAAAAAPQSSRFVPRLLLWD